MKPWSYATEDSSINLHLYSAYIQWQFKTFNDRMNILMVHVCTWLLPLPLFHSLVLSLFLTLSFLSIFFFILFILFSFLIFCLQNFFFNLSCFLWPFSSIHLWNIDKSKVIWFDLISTLLYFVFFMFVFFTCFSSSQDTLEYRKKIRPLRIKMLDGSAKTLLVSVWYLWVCSIAFIALFKV